jgi:hypothetical protein
VVATLPSGSRLFLFADQFEETFTPSRDLKDETLRAFLARQRTFLDALLDAADTPGVTVVFALRADFYGQVLADERFGSRVDAGLVNVLPMTAARRSSAPRGKPARASRRGWSSASSPQSRARPVTCPCSSLR